MNSERVQVLDHGYIQLIESWGSDERIVEAARMSTDKGFQGWGVEETCDACDGTGTGTKARGTGPGSLCYECRGSKVRVNKPGDEKLLKYLWDNKHATPFEMGGAIIEVQAPIFVFREWHRHRTQCLAGDTRLHFDLPGGIERRGTQKYTLTIAEVYEKFQPTARAERPQRQTNALWPRERIQAMQLRCVNEETLGLTHTTIVDVWQSGVKPIYEIEVDGMKIRCSADHRFFTPNGWLRLRDMGPLTTSTTTDGHAVYMVIGAPSESVEFEVPPIESEETWRPALGWEGWYEVSDMGRVRRIAPGQGARLGACKKLSPDKAGYLCVSLNRPGEQLRPHVHKLVLEAFVGAAPEGTECCHADGNSMNNWLSNLRWGTPQENADDRVRHGRVPSLKTLAKKITRVMHVGDEMTYDIEVADPWHNFVAEGFVVHNSYNELSARYTPLPDLNYIPTVERLLINSKTNKQAGTVKDAEELTPETAESYRKTLGRMYLDDQAFYETALKMGVPKELARIHLPVGRFSRMRASANLRNWLAFLTLRDHQAAQWEIRSYASILHRILAEVFPRTLTIFDGTTV